MARFQPVTQADVDRKVRRETGPIAVRAKFNRHRGYIVVTLNTGLELGFPARSAQGLEDASDDALARVEVTGAGYGLHFPILDADFSIPRLVEGFLGSREWIKREGRARASRENGKLGGRPKKEVVPAE